MKFLLPVFSLSVFAIAIVATVATVEPTQAHFLWYDSVNDCEIRYDDRTKYDTARRTGERLWEDLKGSDDCVNVAPADANNSADVRLKDVNKPGAHWAGLYQWWPIAVDSIKFNESVMDSYQNDCVEANVAAHELGHAHRLAHSYINNVMHDHVHGRCTLGTHDEDDYTEKWGDAE